MVKKICIGESVVEVIQYQLKLAISKNISNMKNYIPLIFLVHFVYYIFLLYNV